MASRKELANAIRALSMDAVQKAKSGHPGAPMGMADIAEVLWNDHLEHNPGNPKWADRDRFVLSNGHGSMLIYSLLHLTGYDLSIDDLKNFRQLHSKTPGHPEYGYAPGVETTTGPLGQGITNAVGMAIAEKVLAGQFNRDGHHIVDQGHPCRQLAAGGKHAAHVTSPAAPPQGLLMSTLAGPEQSVSRPGYADPPGKTARQFGGLIEATLPESRRRHGYRQQEFGPGRLPVGGSGDASASAALRPRS